MQQLLWVLMWSTVMGLVLQMMSVRIANVTGEILVNIVFKCNARYRSSQYLLTIFECTLTLLLVRRS